MIRVAILAQTHAMRLGLRQLLAQDEQVEVAADAGSPARLSDWNIDVLIESIDHQEEGLRSFEVESLLRDSGAYPAILLLCDDPGAVQEYARIPFRAIGILSQDASAEEMSAAVRALSEGLSVGERSQLEGLLESSKTETPRLALDRSAETGLIEPLTPRETEILQLLAQGLPNKQIAYSLRISEHTVKFHISSIYSKLGAYNRTEAVRIGAQNGLVVF